MKELNPRQLAFIQKYLETGNGTASARAAGYRGTDKALDVTARRMLHRPSVAAEIRRRQEVIVAKGESKVDELRKFWTEVMEDKTQEMSQRLKASELLGKNEGCFIEKKQTEGTVTVRVVRSDESKASLRKEDT